MAEGRPHHVLLIADDPVVARFASDGLHAAGSDQFALQHTPTLAAGLGVLEADGADVVLLALDLPDSSGLPTFLRVHTYAPRLPVVVLCGSDEAETGRWAVEAGALDYVVTGGASVEALGWVLRYAVDHAGWLAQEETARAAAEAVRQRAELLARASAVLAESLDYATTLRHVADLVVGALGAYCLIDLLAEDGSLQRLVAAGPAPDQAEDLQKLAAYAPLPGVADPAWHVLRTGEALLLPHVPEALIDTFARGAEHRDLLRRLGVGTLLVAPLQARGRMLGALQLLWPVPCPRPATGTLSAAGSPAQAGDERADLLRLARALADRAAVAIDNARLHSDLETALHAREAFFAAVSHDLRHPLGTIGLWAEQLERLRPQLRDFDDAAVFEHAVARIDAAVRHSVGLVEDILDVARLESGQPVSLERDEVELVSLTREVAGELGELEGRAVAVASEVPELWGAWDAARLARVVANLVANALTYSAANQDVTVHLAREADDGGAWAVLRVQDHGVGIPAADLPHVFERFFRASNVQGRIKGTGLGLWGARRIVEQHRGTLTLASEQGVGTTATVRLPLPPGATERAQRDLADTE